MYSVDLIQKQLHTTLSRRKSYAILSLRPLEFIICDPMFQLVSHEQRDNVFEEGQVNPRFISPLNI